MSKPDGCVGCPLCEIGEGFVAGEGPLDAHMMLVGEAPGADEALTGRPFVGGAGRLLNALLAEAGIRRSHVFIDNVLRCRPPGNKYPKAKVRKEAEAHCRQYDRADVQPTVVVALGEKALNLLTGRKGITRWRGSILEVHPNDPSRSANARPGAVGHSGKRPGPRKGRKRKGDAGPTPVCDTPTEL